MPDNIMLKYDHAEARTFGTLELEFSGVRPGLITLPTYRPAS